MSNRWLDPVDNNTSFAEVVCDNYEAVVEEKRKRVGNDDGILKHPNTRYGRKEESTQLAVQKEGGGKSAKPSGSSQPTRMEVDDFAKKVKECAVLAYKLRLDIEQSNNLRKVLEAMVLDSHVDLTLREFLGIAKREFHDVIMDSIKWKRQPHAD